MILLKEHVSSLNLHKFFVKITLVIISFIKGLSLELENSLKSFSHEILSFKFLYLISAYCPIKFLKISEHHVEYNQSKNYFSNKISKKMKIYQYILLNYSLP